MEAPIRILIADDHPLIRQGLRVVIETQPDLELVGDVGDGERAVSQALALHPDVVIMDLQMPVKDGLAATREIAQADPHVQILVLTSYPDDDNVYTAIKAGAMGFLLKDSSAEYLLDAIRTVHRGESVLHPTVARRLMREIKQPTRLPPTADPLTPRELEVLAGFRKGWRIVRSPMSYLSPSAPFRPTCATFWTNCTSQIVPRRRSTRASKG